MKNFHKVLLNTLIANVTTSFLWFALTFWVYLETRSVMATAIVGGSYMLILAIMSLVFGSIVDKNKKKKVMLWSSVVTLVTYAIAGIIYTQVPEAQLVDWNTGYFWLFGMIILIGGVVENLRNIALSTTVTLLVPKEGRDKANGLVGSVQGLAFMVTSVFSGLSIGYLGMGWTLLIAIVLTGVALVHLLFVQIPEKEIKHDPALAGNKIDFTGGYKAIRAVPGLTALILFTTFNNLVGGVFIALMDPYGLELFTVQWWGIVLGVSSTGFIIGGLIVAKKGLGKSPLRTLLLVNVGVAIVSILFTIREFWLLYALGIFAYMILIPAAEAAEQTILQRVVPFDHQGRVFGLALSVEAAASPITAFAIGPIAQFWIIPYMQGPGGQNLAWLLGTGQARGIAAIFVAAGMIFLAITLLAFKSKSYKLLSKSYAEA